MSLSRATLVVFVAAPIACGARSGLVEATATVDASPPPTKDASGVDASIDDVPDVKVDLPECTPTATLVIAESEVIDAIVVTGPYVYWSTGIRDSYIRRVHWTGTDAPENIAEVQLSLDDAGTSLGPPGAPFGATQLGLFTGNTYLLSFVLFATDSRKRVYGGYLPPRPERTLVVDANAAYWATDRFGIKELSADGTTSKQIVYTSPGTFSLTLDDSFVYWTETDTGRIRRGPRSASDPVDPASSVTLFMDASPYDVAVNDRYVYWTRFDPDGGPGELRRGDKAGVGGPVTLAPKAAFVAADDVHVYWALGDAEGIAWLPQASTEGTPSRVASPSKAFAIDHGCLFFQDDHGIVKMRVD